MSEPRTTSDPAAPEADASPAVPPGAAGGRPRLFLLDGMALAYRAHFALMKSPLRTSHGQATSAVFGFLMALDRILDQEKPEEIAVVFDSQARTFRHDRYADYKATREKMPDEMLPQLEWIRSAVQGEGIPFLRVDGYEADDVIATLARRESRAGKAVWIVSGDKDMLQLVDENVRLYNVMKPGQAEVERIGPPEVIERFGVPAGQVVDVLGLMGDTSDNVPGVPGVGPKTAVRLVQEHGSLEAVLDAAASLPQKKLSESLQAHREAALLSKELVTLDCSVPIGDEPLTRRPQDVPLLRALYGELELRDRLKKLQGGVRLEESRYHAVRDAAAVRKLARDLAATARRGGFVLDTETTGLDPLRAELVGLSFSWREGEAWYVPLNQDPPMFGGEAVLSFAQGQLFAEGPKSGDTDAVLDVLRPVLEDPAVPKTGQNLKYDLHVLAQHGVHVAGVEFDTMIADWVVDPGTRLHGLDDMAMRRLGIKKVKTEALIGSGRQQVTMRAVPIEEATHYACEDADVTFRLRRVLEPELVEKGVDRVFREAEMPLLPVLVRMEAAGVRIDLDRLREISRDIDERAERAEARIHELCGEAFNIRSNATLGTMLFERLCLHEAAGRRRPKKTAKGGGYATDEQTLLELAPYHELPGVVLEYRGLTKLKSTYVDALPTFVNPATGRVHTTFHQTGAATGRLSSSDPNLQNIPIRSDEGKAIREAFVPEPGWRFLSADYSQIELRLLAHLSGDEGLREAFVSGEDIHRATAARVFKVPPAEVTPLLRSRAKAINFGVIYGMGPQRLARDTKTTLEEARTFIEDYFRTYPGVRAFLDRTVDDARRTGYVTTLLGRRRHLPELSSADPRIRNQAENVAMNNPLQGTAADMIKLAMIRIDARLREERLRSRMLVQIHDELLFEAPPEEADALVALVREEMTAAMRLDVPIVVDVGMGANWAEAH
jgi:DNA polymerase-1